MNRVIIGFHQDVAGEWVADLSCLHAQHVRHRPPFQQREWVTTEAGRSSRMETVIDCPLCDRAEMPADLHRVRTAGPFDEGSLPAGLRSSHQVAERTWGCLRVLDGSVAFWMATTPPVSARLTSGQSQALPPGVPHSLSLHGPVTLAIDFLVAGGTKGLT